MSPDRISRIEGEQREVEGKVPEAGGTIKFCFNQEEKKTSKEEEIAISILRSFLHPEIRLTSLN